MASVGAVLAALVVAMAVVAMVGAGGGLGRPLLARSSPPAMARPPGSG